MQKRKILLLIEYYLKFNEYPPVLRKGYNYPIYQRLICKSLKTGDPIKLDDLKESIV